MTIGIGIVGAGIFASEVHFPVWVDLSKRGIVQIIAVWSRSSESSQKLTDKYNSELSSYRSKSTLIQDFDVVSFYGPSEYSKMLELSSIQAVSIALPIFNQPEFALSAHKQGKHVLCEKPLAPNLQSAQNILDETTKVTEITQPLFCIAENYRFEAAFLLSQQYISDVSRFGNILEVSILAHVPFLKDSKYEATQWRRESQHIGGIMLDSGIHIIAGLRLLINAATLSQNDSVSYKISDIKGFASKKSLHLKHCDSVNCVLEFVKDEESGALSRKIGTNLQISYCGMTRRMEYTVLGEYGSLRLERAVQGDKFGYRLEVNYEKHPELNVSQFIGFGGVEGEIEAFAMLVSAREQGVITKNSQLEARLSVKEAYEDFVLMDSILKLE